MKYADADDGVLNKTARFLDTSTLASKPQHDISLLQPRKTPRSSRNLFPADFFSTSGKLRAPRKISPPSSQGPKLVKYTIKPGPPAFADKCRIMIGLLADRKKEGSNSCKKMQPAPLLPLINTPRGETGRQTELKTSLSKDK